jgi:ribonuclease HI
VVDGKKPKEGSTKLNVDASFYAEYFSGATGAVIRDDRGGFVAGSCCTLPLVADAASAEARALRDGLLLAGQVGCLKLVVKSDCMEVISTMQEGENSIGAAAAIYEECSFLSRGFSHVIFIHCARESNKVAHMLACKAEGPQSIVWLEDPPDFFN